MPKKKRHQPLFSKPQSTPPASLETTRPISSQQYSGGNSRSVNQILADLRRLNPSASSSSSSAGPSGVLQPHSRPPPGAPSVPPELRDILDLPEHPALRPRPGRPRHDERGRRLPPGPAAPLSWLAQSRHAPRQVCLPNQGDSQASQKGIIVNSRRTRHGYLPGSYLPDADSLMDLALAAMVRNWETHREYNQYWFSILHGRVRAALVLYLGIYRPHGVVPADLRTLLLPPPERPDDGHEQSEDEGIELGPTSHSLASYNEEVTCLNLTGSIERFMRLNQLTDLLFPAASGTHTRGGIPDSWDSDSPSASLSIPPPLLPNLTQLSLALRPSSTPSINTSWTPFSATSLSWKHLLSLATHLPKLTHLSLAHWPAPALTPNSRDLLVTDSRTGRLLGYSGTGPYSHSLDNGWREALNVLQRLSTRLYGLEWLDLTGCGWVLALGKKCGSDEVDWVDGWGKVETLVLKTGVEVDWQAEHDTSNRRSLVERIDLAEAIAQYIVKKRAGKGKFITVVRDELPPGEEIKRRMAAARNPLGSLGLGEDLAENTSGLDFWQN